MFSLFGGKEKKAGPFDAWGPAPLNIPWQSSELPQFTVVNSPRNPENRQHVPPITILSVGTRPSETAADCLIQMTGDDQVDLSDISWFSISTADHWITQPGFQAKYTRISPQNKNEFLNQRITHRDNILVISQLGNSGDIEIAEYFLRQLVRYYAQVDLFLMLPDRDVNIALAEIRELERFEWSLPFLICEENLTRPRIIRNNQIEPGQMVNHIFYSGSSRNSLSEILYAWIHPASRLGIEQYLNNIYGARGRIGEIAREKGHPYLVNLTAASLYLPRAEHKAFLNSALIKYLFLGGENSTGFLTFDENPDPLQDFIGFANSEHYHPIFRWMLVDLANKQQGDYPLINDSKAYFSAFCRHFGTYINIQFQEGSLSINGFEKLVADLESKISKARTNTTDKSQVLLLELLSLISVFLIKTHTEIQSWKELIFSQPPEPAGIVPSNRPARRAFSFQDLIEERYEASITALKHLMQKDFSRPALDGTLAQDPHLQEAFDQRTKEDSLREKIRWQVDLDQKEKLMLFFCLAVGNEWKKFKAEDLQEDAFLSDIDTVFSGSVVALQSRYTENTFLQAAENKKNELAAAQTSTLQHSCRGSHKSAFVFAKNDVIAKGFSQGAFPDPTFRIVEFGGYPATRICALKIDAVIPLKETTLYTKFIGQIFGNPALYVSYEEKRAAAIESFFTLYYRGNRMLSPEICATFTEQDGKDPILVFFECLFGNLFNWKHSEGQMGGAVTNSWILDPAGNWREEYFYFGSGPANNPLAALVQSYIQFVVTKRYYGTRIEDLQSPFHLDNWQEYLTTLSNAGREKIMDRNTLQTNVLSLLHTVGIITSDDVEKSFPVVVNGIITKLENQGHWLERDFVVVMFYYFESIKNTLEG